MRSSGSAHHFCFGRIHRQEFNSRDAEDFSQTLDRARAHILRAPLDALIPLQIRAEQGGDLLLCQVMPLAQLTNARGDEFE